MAEWCAICGGPNDDAHMSKPHCFEPAGAEVLARLKDAVSQALEELEFELSPTAEYLREAYAAAVEYFR